MVALRMLLTAPIFHCMLRVRISGSWDLRAISSAACCTVAERTLANSRVWVRSAKSSLAIGSPGILSSTSLQPELSRAVPRIRMVATALRM